MSRAIRLLGGLDTSDLEDWARRGNNVLLYRPLDGVPGLLPRP